MVQDITVTLRLLNKLTGPLKAVSKDLARAGRQVKETYVSQVQKANQELDALAKQGLPRFRMELLSVLFFGMQVKKMFTDLIKSTVNFFMEVTKGQTEAGIAITRLSGAFKFLKFSVGDALGTALLPLIPTIVDLTDRVSEFVSENPKLTAAILILGAAFGTLLFLFGTLGLAFSGISQTITTGLIPAYLALSSVISPLLTALGGIIATMGAIALLITVIIALIPNAKDAFFDFFGSIISVVKNVFAVISDIMTGNWENAFDRMKIAMFEFLQAMVQFARLLQSVIAGVTEAIVGIIGGAVVLMLRGIDMMNSALGNSTNLAGRFSRSLLEVTDSIGNSFGQNSLRGIESDIQGRIDVAQGRISQRNAQSSQQGNTNISIDSINITGADSQDIYERFLDEIKQRSGGLRANNL